MNKNLLILGAGQYAYVVEEIAIAMNCFDKIDFLDDNSAKAIGRMDELDKFKDDYSYGIAAVGNPDIRELLINRMVSSGFKVPTLIHPLAFVSSRAELGRGVIVEPNATVQANVKVGDGCIISSGATLRHNAIVGNYSHCDCNCVVMSSSTVSEKTKIKCGEIY